MFFSFSSTSFPGSALGVALLPLSYFFLKFDLIP
jgi:hypothetical protein